MAFEPEYKSSNRPRFQPHFNQNQPMILHQQKRIENQCSHAHHKYVSSGYWVITGQGRLEAKLGLFKVIQHGERIHTGHDKARSQFGLSN